MPLFRPDREKDADQQNSIRAAMARSLQVLKSSSLPDTFLGRKTQEPFPQEDEDTHMAKWMASKELKPPQ